MKKFSLILITLLLSVGYANSQKVRIGEGAVSAVPGGDSPAFIDGSTGADARDTTETTLKSKGLIFPRVNLSKITAIPNNPNPNSFPTHYDGMIVYNTQDGGIAGIGNTEGALTRGFWYYENKTANKNGGTWKPLGNGGNLSVEQIISLGDSIAKYFPQMNLGDTIVDYIAKTAFLQKMSTEERNNMTDAAFKADEKMWGFMIFNTDIMCIEYWNNKKWVSLCLGTANITLTGDLCVYDPTALVPADGVQEICTYTPKDDPACVVPSGQAYQVYLTAGSAYATIVVDELTSAFKIAFSRNNSAYNRIAVVRVVNNCSGEFQDFPFIQKGAICPVAAEPVVKTTFTTIYAGGSTYAWVSNIQENIEYVWEYGGVIVHTGNYMEVKRPGTYTVYAGLLGCGTGAKFTMTASEMPAPSPVTASVSNSGMICGETGTVRLSATPSPTGNNIILWFHNGALHNTHGTSINITGKASAGEWFAVQMNIIDNSYSSKSNTLNIIYNENASALPVPVVTINDKPMGDNITICKNGTLELKVTNSYPAGTIFEWFDNGVSISKSDQPIFYTVSPDRNEMTLSVEVSSSAGGCPVSAVSQTTNITLSAPASTTINNGASKASICGSGEATLIADNSSGAEYQWLWNGTAVAGATAAVYKTQTPGQYAVRYRNASGCWSIISANILVETNAAIALSWLGGTPSATETFPNDKTYAVTAIPAAESFTWHSSNTDVASITPIGNGQSATINYKKAGSVTITVTSEDNGCGVSTLTLPISVNAGCSPITSLTLIPSGTPSINKYVNANNSYQTESDGYTDFMVTANGGSTPTGYQWYVDGIAQSGATNSTFRYVTPTNGTQTKVVKVVVKNNCTPNDNDAGISAQASVNVIKFAAEDASGSYRINGKNCFDVAQSNDGGSCAPLSSRVSDFPGDNPSQTYTFAPTGSASYSDLTFVISDPNGLIASSTRNIASGTTNNPSTLTIVFNKAAVIEKATGKSKVEALPVTIIAMYKDNSGANKQISLMLSIQDCTCGCTVKTMGGGTLTFMCYNLGADEATKTLTPIQQAHTPAGWGDSDPKIYGSLYQWGRKTDGHEKRNASVVNGGSNAMSVSFDTNSQIPSSSSTYYGKFIYFPVGNNGNSDWHGNHSSKVNNNLWNFSTYPANNPCPPGWRVPTKAEFNSIIGNSTSGITGISGVPAGGMTLLSGNFIKWNPASNGTAGWLFSPDGGQNYTLFLPAAGSRSVHDGYISSSGKQGVYWNTTSGNTMMFTGTSFGNSGYLNANGFSVRCVAE